MMQMNRWPRPRSANRQHSSGRTHAELMKAGLLTETEFEQQKARILNG